MSTQTLTQFKEFASVQAVVSWSDILEATKIVDDEDMGAPWEEHDGWEHNLVEIEHDDERKAVGVVFTERKAKRVVLDKPESWGNFAYFRALGASKQVAAELTAKIHHDAKETIARWHNYGCHWFGVWCRMEIGQVQVNESLWGIQTENDSADDPYLQIVREDIARQAVDELERQGLFVIGVPEVTEGESYRDAHLRRLLENKRGLNSQNFAGN
jgi:hypothetical protein